MIELNMLEVWNLPSYIKISYPHIAMWAVILLAISLYIYRDLKHRPFLMALGYFVFYAIAIFVAVNMRNMEFLIASEGYMALLFIVCLYFFFMWLPMRLEYDPKAEAKIQLLNAKVNITHEDMELLYKLKRSTKEAYDIKFKELFDFKDKTEKY